MSTETLIILAVVVLLAVLVALYNRLVTLRNRVDEAWADIEVQLKRRFNLIPNLVETVKGYMTHEQETLTKVTELRTKALSATSVAEQAESENLLSGALKSLFAVAEQYPDLKANQNFIELQRELVDAEDKIQAARRFYNSVVRDYNTALQTIPTNIIAALFGFRPREFFEITDEKEREVVSVSFDKSTTASQESQSSENAK